MSCAAYAPTFRATCTSDDDYQVLLDEECVVSRFADHIHTIEAIPLSRRHKRELLTKAPGSGPSRV